MTCPSQSSRLNHRWTYIRWTVLTMLGERYKLWISSLWSLLHSITGGIVLLNTPDCNQINLYLWGFKEEIWSLLCWQIHAVLSTETSSNARKQQFYALFAHCLRWGDVFRLIKNLRNIMLRCAFSDFITTRCNSLQPLPNGECVWKPEIFTLQFKISPYVPYQGSVL